ncbi:MAG: MAPEG family protein [Inhella sp.]|nr:MAPEG family protein [Inhella sp.]
MSTLANYCILAACVLPIVCTGIAKAPGFGKRRRDGGYDNHDPRAWLARQTGRAARANNAQANGFEALPLFIAGVLLAQMGGGAQGTVDALALGFIACRVAYIALYLADLQLLRSLVWAGGFGLSVALFFVA